MTRKYQKLTACFLLLLAASPFLYGIYLQTSQVIIQHKMREEIEKKNLVTITVNITDVKWTREGEEAFINGDLFDVEKYSINKNKIQLTGLFDKAEDKLVSQLGDIQRKNNPDNSTSSSLVFQLMSCFSICTLENQPTDFHSFNDSQNYSPFQNPMIASVDLLSDTPPPKSTSLL